MVAAAASPAVPISEVLALLSPRVAEAAATPGGFAPCALNVAGGATPVGLYPPRCEAKAMESPPGIPEAPPAPPATPSTRPPAFAGSSGASFTMSKSELRRLRLFMLFWRMKYFCACDATCVGVRDCTKCREMPRQSP